MTIVAVAGDACTTTTRGARRRLAELGQRDRGRSRSHRRRSGGVVRPAGRAIAVDARHTHARRRLSPRSTATLGSPAPDLRLIPAPARAGEAQQAVAEAARSVVATLSTPRSPMTFVDTGRLAQPPVVASVRRTPPRCVVLVHRQSTQSAAAAAVRLQRLAEQIEVSAKRELPRSSSRSSEQPRSISTRSRRSSPMASAAAR